MNTEVKHKKGTREEWLKARLDLLRQEKALTQRSDELAKQRQELPWVRVDKAYNFQTEDGKVTLGDLFRGRSQLLVYHFMFGPDYTAGCPACSAIADGFNGVHVHLANHDVMFWAMSRAPFKKLDTFKQRMEWTFPWASSFGSDFNDDFSVHFTHKQQLEGAIEYNYQREEPLKELKGDEIDSQPIPDDKNATMVGTDVATYTQERPGMSAFVIEDGLVYHTYSTYARGLDILWSTYQWLDRAPKGRNEQDFWWRRRDEYKQG
jgi:predicted dithiol-disulfide oxidoreductase (DUF899 family)